MYTFKTRSSFESPASKSAILSTAQPKGRLYCTLQAFFFSPAPIRPAKQNTYLMHYPLNCLSQHHRREAESNPAPHGDRSE